MSDVSGPLYVYAIAGEAIPLDGLSGVSGEPLLIVSIEACHAVAGRLIAGDSVAAGSAAHAPPPSHLTAETLHAQDALVRALAARTDALLPARFGSRVEDEASLRRTLDSRAPDLTAALARVRGREQMTIRLFATATMPPQRLAERVFKENGTAAEAEPQPNEVAERGAVGPGTRYLQQRADDGRRIQDVAAIVAVHLGPLAADTRVDRGRPPVIGSIHHLIPRGTADQYCAALEADAVTTTLAARGIRLRVSGPSPAYAFAEANPS